ncbi:MAG: hypothetical protein AAGD07_04055 [Planctomycetota bacterium]
MIPSISRNASLAPVTSNSTNQWLWRRTRFQLAPLMDLLLIIVFAQFLDVRETSQKQVDALVAEQRASRTRVLKAEAEATAAKTEADRRSAPLRSQIAALQQSREEAETRARRDATRMNQALRTLAAGIGISDTQLRGFAIGGDDDAEIAVERAIALSQQLSRSSPAAVMRFLVGHEELLKRAEVWNTHVLPSGDIKLIAGERTQEFRLEGTTQDARTQEAIDQFYAAYKQLPESKGLVVVLVSFDGMSRAGVYQPLLDAMPDAMDRLRLDNPGNRFEFTVLGTTPDPQESTPPE